MKQTLSILIFLIVSPVFSQIGSEDIGNNNQNLITEAEMKDRKGLRLPLSPKPRFAVGSYVVNGLFNIESESNTPTVEDGSARVKRYEEIYGKLKFPLYLGDKAQVVGGVDFRYHEYNFDNPAALENNFYRTLQDKHLNRAAFALYFTRLLKNSRFLVMKSGIQLSGDYSDKTIEKNEFLKFSTTALYGFRISDQFSWGFGGYYSYQPQRHSIYPALVFNYWKNERWGLQAVLPAQINILRRFNENSYLTFGYGLKSARYLLVTTNPQISPDKTSALGRTDIQLYTDYQFKLFAFVGASVTAGLNWNYNMKLESSLSRDADELVVNDIGFSPFGQATLFLTIPDRFTDKEKEP